MKRYRHWMSWYEATDQNYQPITDPPTEAVLGWWVVDKKYYGVELCTLLCALIVTETSSDADAWGVVDANWPGASRRPRFNYWKPCDWVPNTEAFPRTEWMTARLEGKQA